MADTPEFGFVDVAAERNGIGAVVEYQVRASPGPAGLRRWLLDAKIPHARDVVFSSNTESRQTQEQNKAARLCADDLATECY